MSKLMNGLKLTSGMTLAILLVGAYQPVSAQHLPGSSAQSAPSFPAAVDPASPAKVAPGHVLKNTYLRQGAYEANVPAATYTALDTAITVACPAGPCSINAHMVAENGEGSATGNASTLVVYVDGKGVSGVSECCWIVGETPADGSFVNVSQDLYINELATGNHTIQLYYYSEFGAYVAHWEAAYTLYEP